jgi:diguanylate cyclase (GGDEF)-like protein
VLSGNRETYLLFLLALAFVLERSFAGFFRASASNVIATSREFVFSNLSTMILILSRKQRILEWNRSPDNFVFKLVPPKYRQPFSDYRAKLLKAGHGVVSNHDGNIISVTHEGHEHHLLITPAAIKEGNREFGQLIEIADITHIYSVLRYIESIAVYDQLTELYNRNAYLDKASTVITPANLPLLIMIGDVNTLKLVNDNVGHIAGDRLLKTIADVVKELAPEDSFVARIGGDEIAILVANAEEDVAEEFAAKVRDRTASLFDEDFGKPDISLGWAVARSMNDDYNEIFKIADQMMYREKKAYKEAMGISLSGALPERREQAKATDEPVAAPEYVVAAEHVIPAASEPVAPAAPEPAAVPEPVAPVAPEPAAVPEPVLPVEPEPAAAPEPVAPELTLPIEPEPPAAPEPVAPELALPIEPEPTAAPEPVLPAEPEPEPTPTPVTPEPAPEPVAEEPAIPAPPKAPSFAWQPSAPEPQEAQPEPDAPEAPAEPEPAPVPFSAPVPFTVPAPFSAPAPEPEPVAPAPEPVAPAPPKASSFAWKPPAPAEAEPAPAEEGPAPAEEGPAKAEPPKTPSFTWKPPQ